MPENEIPDLMRTILSAGFDVTTVQTKPNYVVMELARADEFGIRMKYILAYAGNGPIPATDVEALEKVSTYKGASLVLVSCSGNTGDSVVLTKTEFFNRVGGIVTSMLPLEPEFGSQLVTLGKNQLPAGLHGSADDLFEAYVHAGLQFLLRGRVLRYGQDRRFEAVPDGLVLSRSAPLMLYDAKASDPRYEFDRTAIRQFADYVRKFHERYESYVGRLYSFVVVSHAFQDETVLSARSNELYADCGVPMVCLTADALAKIVSLFAEHPALRVVVDWKEIFTSPIVRFEKAEEVIEARKRDRIVRR